MENPVLGKIISIGRYTLIANFRNRLFLVVILFGLMLLASSVLLSVLGQEQEIRMLLDIGLASIELLSLLMAVFLMVNLILEDMESRSIYLILTRSISRVEYLLGRFLGTIASVALCAGIMALGHLAILLFKGWSPAGQGSIYFLALFMSMEKIFLISALALLFSLFSSSGAVAWIFTFFFWVLGHFALELKFLSQELTGTFLKLLFKGIYFLIPHFQYLNARDLWLAVTDRMTNFVLFGSLYTLAYSALTFTLATILFRKKEF